MIISEFVSDTLTLCEKNSTFMLQNGGINHTLLVVGRYLRIRFYWSFQCISNTIPFSQRCFFIDCHTKHSTLLESNGQLCDESKAISQTMQKKNVLTWTPSTLSTKRWPLFLLIKSAVIESEYEFNVAGTSSNGELLCSILRHRLNYFLLKWKISKQIENGSLSRQNCYYYVEMGGGLAAWHTYLQKLLWSHVLKLFLSTVMTHVNSAAAHKTAAIIFILSEWVDKQL